MRERSRGDEARAVLERADQALEAVRALTEVERTELHVGYASWAIDPRIQGILGTFRRDMPNVRLVLYDRKIEELVDALLEGTLPLAFIFHAPKSGALRGLHLLPLSRENMRLAVHPAHPFVAREVVSLEEAAAEDFVALTLGEYPDSHFFLDAVFASTHNKPRIIEERDSVPGVVSAIEAGIGAAVAAERLRHTFGSRIRFVGLQPEPDPVETGLAARKGPLDPIAEKFWQIAKDALPGR